MPAWLNQVKVGGTPNLNNGNKEDHKLWCNKHKITIMQAKKEEIGETKTLITGILKVHQKLIL